MAKREEPEQCLGNSYKLYIQVLDVDTTAQYDAVRAYLKELDISNAVWVGLIRSNPDGDFTWTDYRGLSGDGYWSSAPDPRSAPLCAAADPAADYRWEARTCGGPTVASFICELPVPQWALGNDGCMVRELPALTVLYLPESAAVELTADCGLAGVKKVQCTGNLKREDLLRGLSCGEEDEQSSTPNTGATTSGFPSFVSSENPVTDTVSDITTDDNITTEHEDDINQSSTVKPTEHPYYMRPSLSEKAAKQIINNVNKILISKNVALDEALNNNLQSNNIPNIYGNDNSLPNDLSERLEDETHKQYKMLHDEIARHGNFETIFTQPTDHFVPPLVMAKAKISDDMTVLSLEEKYAQQIAEQRYSKYTHYEDVTSEKQVMASTTIGKDLNSTKDADRPLITTTPVNILKTDIKKEVLKLTVPKKYNDKYSGIKTKTSKAAENKTINTEKTTERFPTASETSQNYLDTTTSKYVKNDTDTKENEPSIDLTVIIKEPNIKNYNKALSETNENIPKIEIIQNDTSITEPEIKLGDPKTNDGQITQKISVKLPTTSINNFTLSHEVIKITILKEENTSEAPTVFEVTTKMYNFEENAFETTASPLIKDLTNETPKDSSMLNDTLMTNSSTEKNENFTETTPLTQLITSTMKVEAIDDDTVTQTEQTFTTTGYLVTTLPNNNVTDLPQKKYANMTELPIFLITKTEHEDTDLHEEYNAENNITETSESIDDFQSPLLSGANEPPHRPNRSRRPQPANRINKFNPFRILG